MISIALTFPPSTNSLFPTRGKRRVISEDYTEWRNTNGWEIQMQKPGKIKGQVRIELRLEDKGRGDADNYLKAPIDLLVKHGVIQSDSRTTVRKVSAEWDGSITGAVVSVYPI